jgi:selenocysteine-specific translation elongation factor
MAAEREVTKELGQQLGKAIDMPYFETSAKTGEGVESAI